MHVAAGTLHNGPLRPSLPSSGRIWTCRGVSSSVSRIEERSPKSKLERQHPGAKVWIQEVFPLSAMASLTEASTTGPQTDLVTNDRTHRNINIEEDDQCPNQIGLKNIPQKKSYNLAGVFRYWLGAIRSVIDAAILEIQSSSN